jgi:hypothetical protein
MLGSNPSAVSVASTDRKGMLRRLLRNAASEQHQEEIETLAAGAFLFCGDCREVLPDRPQTGCNLAVRKPPPRMLIIRLRL